MKFSVWQSLDKDLFVASIR